MSQAKQTLAAVFQQLSASLDHMSPAEQEAITAKLGMLQQSMAKVDQQVIRAEALYNIAVRELMEEDEPFRALEGEEKAYWIQLSERLGFDPAEVKPADLTKPDHKDADCQCHDCVPQELGEKPELRVMSSDEMPPELRVMLNKMFGAPGQGN